MKDSEYIKIFLDFLREASIQAKISAEDERRGEQETQDVLHRLELYDDNHYETARLGKLIRKIRRERRSAKRARERLEPIASWAQDNKAAVKSLERLLGTVRDIEKVQEARVWTPRTNVLEKTATEEAKS